MMANKVTGNSDLFDCIIHFLMYNEYHHRSKLHEILRLKKWNIHDQFMLAVGHVSFLTRTAVLV